MEPKRPWTHVYTVEQAAIALQVSKDVIYDELQRGAMPGRKVGGIWRISIAALDRWLEERRPTPAPIQTYPHWPHNAGDVLR